MVTKQGAELSFSVSQTRGLLGPGPVPGKQTHSISSVCKYSLGEEAGVDRGTVVSTDPVGLRGSFTFVPN